MCGRLSIRTPGAALNSRMRSSGWPTISARRRRLCLDTGHLYYAGMDPLDWLDRYYLRLDYLHFKDVDPQVYQRAIHEGIDFFTACAKGVMCPLGSGAIDYPAIKDFLARRGIRAG
ncbi:putative epimerase/isomerase [Klebsiella pneumoniae]|uniref:Putative epimerase/isomerase n=1 Tax=Klebsiella pneumoniae TaxID=573 RepID=A0A378B852_KLEPN|nr:putative epimerase/isomerase [Klebsiella pneumoniae]